MRPGGRSRADPRGHHAGDVEGGDQADGGTVAAGSRFPGGLLRRLQRCDDDEAVKRVGISWATEQCADLLDHQVRGIHFYTLNRSDATRQIYLNLGVRDSASLR